MIRTLPLVIPAGGNARFGPCYGFAVVRGSGTEFPLTALVTYEEGEEELRVREGVWYGGREKMLAVEVSVPSGTAGAYYVDRGANRDDIAAPVSSAADPGDPWEEENYESIQGANFAAAPYNPWAFTALRPAWADRLTIITTCGSATVTPKAEIWAVNAQGVLSYSSLSPEAATGSALDIPFWQTGYEYPWAILGHHRSGTAADAIGITPTAGIGNPPKFSVPYLPAGGIYLRTFQGAMVAGRTLKYTFRWHRWKG